MSSRSAQTARFGPALRPALEEAAKGYDALRSLMRTFVEQVRDNTWQRTGWPSAGVAVWVPPVAPLLGLPTDSRSRIHVRANALGVYLTAGPHHTAYCVSKAGLNAGTRLLAAEAAAQGLDVVVNACCPGWVQTDMAGPLAPSTVAEGASTPVVLASDVAVTDSFFAEGKLIPW